MERSADPEPNLKPSRLDRRYIKLLVAPDAVQFSIARFHFEHGARPLIRLLVPDIRLLADRRESTRRVSRLRE